MNGARRSASVASKAASLALVALDVNRQRRAGRGDTPEVALLHRHERGHVQLLLKAPRENGSFIRSREYVGVALSPRRAGHLCHDRLELVLGREAVVEADGVEAVPERAQLREQADRPRRQPARPALHLHAHRICEPNGGIAEVVGIGGSESGPGRSATSRPPSRPSSSSRSRYDERHAVAELVGPHRKAPVADRALVDRAGFHAPTASIRRAPISRTTRSALLTPSSWKPHPQ